MHHSLIPINAYSEQLHQLHNNLIKLQATLIIGVFQAYHKKSFEFDSFMIFYSAVEEKGKLTGMEEQSN